MAECGALVVCETRDGAATALTLELLGIVRALAENHPHPNPPPEGEGMKGGRLKEGTLVPSLAFSARRVPEGPLRGRVRVGVVALLMGDSSSTAADLIAHGADRVFVCPADSEDYESEVWTREAAHLARALRPALILAGHTPAGADLAPRLAFRLQSGIATGCVRLAAESDRIICTRPCYGGNAHETVSFPEGAAVVTMRSGIGAPQLDRSRHGEVIKLEAPQRASRVRVLGRERETAAGTRLEDAKIVVAGGRGLEGPEGFGVLESLAAVLGAAVGSSRVPCDLGWVPHSKQIGLTGKTVTPDLYFAIGISGAGHHMAGCGNARAIVAINTDANAAIFKEARFGVVGDYRKVVPALAEAIAQLKKEV